VYWFERGGGYALRSNLTQLSPTSQSVHQTAINQSINQSINHRPKEDTLQKALFNQKVGIKDHAL